MLKKLIIFGYFRLIRINKKMEQMHLKKKIIVFSKNEKKIITSIKNLISDRDRKNEIISIRNNETALKELAKSISLYPSIFGEQQLGNSSRSVLTLIDNLCITDTVDLIMHVPTKAILGRSFSIAKINFFLLLLYLTREIQGLNNIEERIIEIISVNIYSLMAEEVFISILSDKKIPRKIRNDSAFLLANIWEYRIDHGVKNFVPILNNIWAKRKDFIPAYGTMLGISELFIIFSESESVWLDFLARDDIQDDEINSLKEFLMSLSFENINELTVRMKMLGKTSINADELNSLIDSDSPLPVYGQKDPRDFFKSFTQRKNDAIFRRQSNLPGPKKTIEEYIMCYLLGRSSFYYDSPQTTDS